MTNLQIVILIISMSTLISVVYLIVAFINKSIEMKINGVIMLFSPPAGLVYYFGQFMIQLLSRKDREMQLDDIGFSKERHNRVSSPDIELEMQTMPLEEILLVSDNSEKRRYLLSELKKEYIINYGTIVKALDNDDPEVSHYAASAITSAKAEFENDIRDFDNRYNRNKGDLELIRHYADYVYSYIKSGILDPMEIRKYSFLFINILTGVESPEKFLTELDYTNIVNESIIVNDFTIAEHWADFAHKLFENESTYMNLLKIYYYTNRTEQMLKTLDDMKKTDLLLSYEGLSLVRFFIKTYNGNEKNTSLTSEKEEDIPGKAELSVKEELLLKTDLSEKEELPLKTGLSVKVELPLKNDIPNIKDMLVKKDIIVRNKKNKQSIEPMHRLSLKPVLVGGAAVLISIYLCCRNHKSSPDERVFKS